MTKSTSPVSDLIIIWENTDKKINNNQIRDPIKFEDILNLEKVYHKHYKDIHMKTSILNNNNK